MHISQETIIFIDKENVQKMTIIIELDYLWPFMYIQDMNTYNR